MNIKKKIERRFFIKGASLGILGAGLNLRASDKEKKETVLPDAQPKKSGIKEYRTLGRTNFKVSDISSGFCNNEAVLNQLFDAGVNYVDSAESYGNETVVGNVLKQRERKKFFITTKLELKQDVTKQQVLERSLKCLERLQTEYIDCMMIHSPENIKTIKSEAFHEAMKQLKSEGKIRFVGISNHGGSFGTTPKESMEQVLTAAALDGRFDVMLLAYNFLQDDNGTKVIQICREKNIGTTLMKVNPVGSYYSLKARLEEMKTQGKPISEQYQAILKTLADKTARAEKFIKEYQLQNPNEIRDASIKYCLNNPGVNAVCCSFRNFDDIDKYLPLSGQRLTEPEKKKLSNYKESCGFLYCRHACNICETECPQHVPVNTIMRYYHYYDANGREKYAMNRYAALKAPNALNCQNCQGYCEPKCPYGVSIHGLLALAHQRLSLG
jgi:predicted aldo/keto reductase-like oxidoreductase